MSQTAYIKIGALAKQTGLSVGTLRYYSDRGLLQPSQIGDNGYRYYSQDGAKQVQFIKKAQAIGFSLEEIKTILDVRDRGDLPCNLVQSLLDRKIEQLTSKIQQMSLFKQELEAYRDTWLDNPQLGLNRDRQDICPLIASVSLSNVDS